MRVFTLLVLFSYLFNQFGLGLSGSITTLNKCGDTKAIENIKQCKVCTDHDVAQNSSHPRECFEEGVYPRFFKCSGPICSFILKTSTRNIQQRNQTVEKLECYFDLSQGENNSGYPTRFYINKTSVCSNSTFFTVHRLKTGIAVKFTSEVTNGNNSYF